MFNPIDDEEVAMDRTTEPFEGEHNHPKHRADQQVDAEGDTGADVDLEEFGENPDTELAG